MGKARTFSDPARDSVYQKEYDNEVYSTAAQQNSYNLGSTHFSDQSGIGNFTQAGSDQRKASIKGALFQGNIGFNQQTAVLDVPSTTIDLLEDGSSAALALVSTDRLVSLSTGTVSDLVTIIGAQRPGQRLFLYGILGNTITIKHTAAATANTILTPDKADFDFSDNIVVELVYDISTSKWRIIGGVGGGGATVPVGTAENQHLEWDNSGLVWNAVDFLTMGTTGPFADTGEFRFPNDVIWAAGRTGADDGNIELKFTTQDELDLTNSNNSTVALLLRAQDAVDPDQLFLISQVPGTTGGAFLTAPNNMTLLSNTVTANMVLSTTNVLFGTDIHMAGLNDVRLDTDNDSGIGSTADDIVQIFTNSIIRFAVTLTDAQLGVDLVMTNNDITSVQALAFNDIGAQIAVADDAAGYNFVHTSATRPFRFTPNSTNVLDIIPTGMTFLGSSKILDLAGNNIDNVGTLEFQTANITISSDTGGMNLSVPDATDDYTFTINAVDSLVLEKFFANWSDTVQQYNERLDPAAPAAGDVYFYAKLDGGIAKLFYRQSDSTIVGPLGSGGGGSQTPWTSNIDADGFDLQDLSNIEFRDTTGAPGSSTNAIWTDSGGINIQAGSLSDSIDFRLGSNIEISLQEDGELIWIQDGHRLIPQGTAFQMISSSTSDRIELTNGTGSTNAILTLENTRCTWRTQTSSTQAYALQLIQNNNTPADFRTIVNIDMIAENSSSVDTIYARISASSQDFTNATEDGLLQLGVVSGGTLIAAIDMEGSSSGGANDAMIGFFGETPVVQQSVASDTLANLYTALRNLGLIV